MKRAIIICCLGVAISLGCKSSKDVKQEETRTSDVKDTLREELPVVPSSPQPSAIKPNVTFIGAYIDSVHLLEGFNYRLFILVQTAIPVGGMESILEPGQHISAMPAYVVNEAGVIDITNERNKKLLELRSAKAGDVFLGQVSLTDKHGWVVTEVEAY